MIQRQVLVKGFFKLSWKQSCWQRPATEEGSVTWRRPKKTSSTRCEGELWLGTGCRVLGTCVPSNSTASPQVVPTRSLKLAPLSVPHSFACFFQLGFMAWTEHGRFSSWMSNRVREDEIREKMQEDTSRHSVKPAIPTRGVFRWSHPTDICCLSHTSPKFDVEDLVALKIASFTCQAGLFAQKLESGGLLHSLKQQVRSSARFV